MVHHLPLSLRPHILVLALGAVSFDCGVTAAAEPEDALSLSRATGRPILAIGSSASCGPCRAMHAMLQTSPQLQPLLSEFIVLKMDAASSEFQRLLRLFPADMAGVPMVFVVRGDGQPLYARSGSLPEQNMHQLLQYALDESGTTLTPDQVAAYQERLVRAEQLARQGQPGEALQLVHKIADVGSHAAVVDHARRYRAEIVGATDQWLDDLAQQMSVAQTRHAAAYRIAELYVALEGNPRLREKAGQSLLKFEAQQDAQEAVRQAKDLVRGRMQEDRQLRDAALVSYRRVVHIDDQSPAAQHAQRRIAVITRQRTDKLSGPSNTLQIPGRVTVTRP